MRTIVEMLTAQAARRPDAVALLAPGRPPATYADLAGQVRTLTRALRGRALGPASRIAVCLPNGPEAATATLSVAALATCAPLNPGYREEELRFYLQDARAEAVVVPAGETGPIVRVAAQLGLRTLGVVADARRPAGCFELAGPTPAPDDDDGDGAGGALPGAGDVALVLHTSGTTARPKIVPLSQSNLSASAQGIAAHLGLSPADRGLNVMPLFHIHGLVGSLMATVASGGSLVCTPGFDETRFFDWVAEFDPTWYSAVPTIHQSVVAHGAAYRQRAPAHRFRFVRSSSAALPPATLRALEALLEAPVIEAYGMTEASHQMTSNPLPPRARKPGSVGLPAGVEVAILDDSGQVLAAGRTGEIAIDGPGVTPGYENNPEANAKAFAGRWFRTGDQGWLDEDGYLHITGRLKEIVNRGGEKVSPREIDEALLEHADVAQAVCFAVPHPSLGEDLVAAVVARPGCRPDEAALRGFLFSRLAPFKVPSRIVFVDAIPKGPTGKVQRTSLHEKLADRLAVPFVAPATPTEELVASVFREVLRSPPLGANANFFACGGDSLRGIQAISRLNRQLALELPPVRLFTHPTVSALALAIEDALKAGSEREAALAAEIDAMSDEEVERMLAAMEGADGDAGQGGAMAAGDGPARTGAPR